MGDALKSIIPSLAWLLSDLCRKGHIFLNVLAPLGQNARITISCLKHIILVSLIPSWTSGSQIRTLAGALHLVFLLLVTQWIYAMHWWQVSREQVPYIQTFKLQTFKDVNVLALHLSLLMVLPFHHLLPPLTCSLDASPCMPAVGLHYYTFQGTMLLLLMLSRFSRARLFATPWAAAHQAPLSMGFSRQEYWSRVPLPSLSRYYSVR